MPPIDSLFSVNPHIEEYAYVDEQRNQRRVEYSRQLFELPFLEQKSVFTKSDRFQEVIDTISAINKEEKLIIPEVANNSIKILSSISRLLLEKIDFNAGNIYASSHGTISVEWKKDNGDEFYLEIGKSSLGFFYEKNGDTEVEVESLSMNSNSENMTIAKVAQSINTFYESDS